MSNKLPWLKTFVNTATAYSKYFDHKKQRENFLTLVKNICLEGSSILSDSIKSAKEVKSWSRSLSHFLKESPWDFRYFKKKIVEIAINKLLSDIKLIAIDKTVIAKPFSSEMEQLGSVYDTKDNSTKPGYYLLTATAVSTKGHYVPLYFKVFSKEEMKQAGSENIVKKEFLQLIINKIKQIEDNPLFVFDSGFARKSLLTLLEQKDISFVAKTQQKRGIELTQKEGKQTLISNLETGIYHNVKITTRGWEDLDTYSVIVETDDNHNKRALLTNLNNQSKKKMTKKEVQNAYQNRWFIEETFKQLKSKFGLEQFQVRSLTAIKRLTTLIFFAAVLTYLALDKHNNWIQKMSRKLLNKQPKTYYPIRYLRRITQILLIGGLQREFVSVLAKDKGCG